MDDWRFGVEGTLYLQGQAQQTLSLKLKTLNPETYSKILIPAGHFFLAVGVE